MRRILLLIACLTLVALRSASGQSVRIQVVDVNRHGTIRVRGYQDGHFTIGRQRSTTKSCTYDGTHY